MSRGPGLGRCHLLCLSPGTHPSAAQVQLRGGVLCQGRWAPPASAHLQGPCLLSTRGLGLWHPRSQFGGCGLLWGSGAGCAWQSQNRL